MDDLKIGIKIYNETAELQNEDLAVASSGCPSGATDEIFQEMRQLGVKDELNAQYEEYLKKENPQEFQVKHLGQKKASGLWGIKHTRTPVDQMVNEAKRNTNFGALPSLKLRVSKAGISLSEMPHNLSRTSAFYPIENISYGVQDLIYTRVFAMIIVREARNVVGPFECHAFVCESRNSARSLTFVLAEAFRHLSIQVKDRAILNQKFAIDLRNPDELEVDLKEAPDSEA